MRRTTSEALDLIRKGMSLNKINKQTKIPKSTLYFHYRKIIGKKIKNPVFNRKDFDKIGEFIGVFAGDGSFYFMRPRYQYRIKIHIGTYEKGYILFLINFLEKLFNKRPRVYESKDNVTILEYYSKDIYNLIREYLVWEENKTKTIRLKRINHVKNFKIGFIRGLFDTDGGINKAKNKTAFGTSSQELANQVRGYLEEMGMPPGFYKYKNKDFWYIDLYGSRTDKFMKTIKPHNPDKIITRL